MNVRSATGDLATVLLEQEVQGLLARLAQIRPFVLSETMVLAAALPYQAHRAIERFLYEGRMALRHRAGTFLDWLRGDGRAAPPEEQQRRFVIIRMHFNDVLSQFDLFAEVVTQRSEHRTGVWLSGLDRLAADAFELPGPYLDPPPVICYLARGPGAAIRRARTRLPGGQSTPVAIIRVPRERMVGHGIGSSLVHEVGHQAAALLGLVESLRSDLQRRRSPATRPVWETWERTVSECIADFWSVAKLGISSTLGLLAVVSLPRFFVFREPGNDPHPMPYLRVLLSAKIGDTLYPHPQWRELANAWKSYYPTTTLTDEQQQSIERLEASLSDMAGLLADHRSAALGGRRLADLMPLSERRPDQLVAMYDAWGADLGVLARQPPSLVFAVVGQARITGRVTPAQESAVLSNLLTSWAVRSSIDVLDRDTHRNSVAPTSSNERQLS